MKRGEGMVSGNGQVGAFIAERRKAKGWSQKDLAGVLQVTDKAVSRWERGAGYPDVTLLKPLALALDVSVAELLEGERLEDAGEEEKRMQQAVEHSLTYYLASSMEARKPLREMIVTAGFWMHFWIIAAAVFFMTGRWLFPGIHGEALLGYLFCFGTLMGLFFIGRIRNMAAEYNLIAPDEYTYRDSESEKDYGDYPNVTAVPLSFGFGKPIAVILGKRERPETKISDIFLWACKFLALILLGWFGGRVFISSVITWQDAVICMFFPFAITGIGFFLTGIWTLWKRDGADEETWSGKRQILYGFLCWGAGAVIILALALFSYIYWYVII